MPADPILMADTQGWLRKAATDLRAAKHDLAAIPPLLADAAFHCQQAVEKVFKAFLMWHSVPFRKTHSLEELGEQCLDVNSTLRALIDCAERLGFDDFMRATVALKGIEGKRLTYRRTH